MLGTFRRIGNELSIAFGNDLPKKFSYRPGTVTVKDNEREPIFFQMLIYANECLGCRLLKKCTRLRIDGAPDKIVRGCVTDVELDRSV